VRRRSPSPPRDVRIRYKDGTEIPVEVAYLGRSAGTHHWEITTLVDLYAFDALIIGIFPAKTSITFGAIER
jgi:hypothetical protein